MSLSSFLREEIMSNNLLQSMQQNYPKLTFLARQIAVFTVAAMALGISGCATSQYTYNEGSTRLAAYTEKSNRATGLYLSSSDLQKSENDIIEIGAAFSVRLLSAFICDFRETSMPADVIAKSNKGAPPCPGGDGGQHSGTRGEIAIVANVGERKASAGLTFDPAGIKSGRVIYYNEDVRETGQLINAMNLPVYGPKTYDGKPFYMDWSVLELDNKENAAARKLLKQLADVGAMPAAPYTPVLKLLNSLGGALIDANGDDLEMRYQMETDPTRDCSGGNCNNMSVRRMPLREGYYAFIRNENRSTDTNLNGVTVCEGLGVLCMEEKPWREKTWLLVRVAREDKAAATAQDNAQNLAGLLDALNANSTLVGPEAQTAISEAIKNILDSAIKARTQKQ
jgi:hypothetical protein